MSITTSHADNSGMTHNYLLNAAIHMAYEAFKDPTDEHIIAVFHRLAWNHRYGLGLVGVTTLH